MEQRHFYLRTLCCVALWVFIASFTASQEINLTDEEANWLANHPTITVAFDGYFPPYSFLNESGSLEGFALDVFRLIEEKLDIRFNVHTEYEWSSIYQSGQDKAVDVIATMVDRPGRSEYFSFTQPYIYKSLVIISRSGETRIRDRADIKNQTVAIVEGYQYAEQLLENHAQIQPLVKPNILETLNSVATGESDFTVSFLGATHYYRSKYLLSNLIYSGVYDKDNSNESIAVRNDWPELASILDKALLSIPEQTLHELRQRWLPEDYEDLLVTINFTEQEKQWLNDHSSVRLGVDPEFAPFEFISNNQYQGIASDYISILSKRLGIEMNVVPELDWSEVIAAARAKEVDILPAVGYSEGRAEFLNFSEPYLTFHRVIVMQDDASFVSGLNDLASAKVAVQENTSHHEYIRENTNITPVLYESLYEALLAVSGGEVDAFVGNVASSTYWIRQHNLLNLKIAAPVSNEVQTLHFAVRNDWPHLASAIQKGLDSIEEERETEILNRWLSVPYEPVVDLTLIYRFAMILLILGLAVALWVYSLRREIKRRTKEHYQTANYDRTTGLPNRFLMNDRLMMLIDEQARSQAQLAIISFDIDEFKKFSDRLGLKVTDVLLKQFAERIREAVPAQYSFGSISRDHFAVIRNNVTDIADVAVLAETLQRSLNEPFFVRGHEILLSLNIGIAMFPGDGGNCEELLRHADTAKNAYRRETDEHYLFYDKNQEEGVARRLTLDHHMRTAVKDNEFFVFFQPKVDAVSEMVVGFEALLRWNNPELGYVSPTEFIPVAEKNSSIEPLGFFVLEQSLIVLGKLQARYQRNFSMAVNLSPVQFKSPKFLSRVSELRRRYGMVFNSVQFEVTEGVLLSGYLGIEEKLQELRALGATLAMDDFGTGYSSMNYLRMYDFDTLKIDREFVSDLETKPSSQKLVEAIVAMANSLGLQVVAEGVETERQKHILKHTGCDLLQGWYFCKALPYEQLLTHLDDHFIQQPKLSSN